LQALSPISTRSDRAPPAAGFGRSVAQPNPLDRQKPSLREQRKTFLQDFRPLTLRGSAPQSQIANTGLMFPTLLHAADPT
jgi:hypothetical protein